MKGTEIVTDETMRELRIHGSQEFPFEYYHDDLFGYESNFIEWHWHSEFEWIYVESGIVVCLIGSERIVLYPGDGMFINSRVLHRFESPDGAALPNILFRPELIAPATSSIYEEYVLPVLNSEYSHYIFRKTEREENHILQKLREIFSECTAAQWEKLDIQISVLMLWRDFIKLVGDTMMECKSTKSMLLQTRIRTMLQFISAHFKEKITFADIALSANISKSEALRCFHLTIQSTPIQYLVDYRLNRAKELLIETEDTITQIAIEVGIDNISYFVRIFTKKFQITPREFRRKYKNASF